MSTDTVLIAIQVIDSKPPTRHLATSFPERAEAQQCWVDCTDLASGKEPSERAPDRRASLLHKPCPEC